MNHRGYAKTSGAKHIMNLHAISPSYTTYRGQSKDFRNIVLLGQPMLKTIESLKNWNVC